MARKRSAPGTTRTQAKRSTKRPSRARAGARTPRGAMIRVWEDDPGAPGSTAQPVTRPVPTASPRLPIAIGGTAPEVGLAPVGTPAFRYWTAAEALARGAEYWAALFPAGVTWEPSNGARLPVSLDEGVDLNAYYDRNGLHFFHAIVQGTTLYSGESPDVVCHELGHAILDALRPQLFDTAALEVAAFHESFGDMSALLCALQLDTFRAAILVDTDGSLDRSSRFSRLAEQLGWGIRQRRPDAVDRDCLRDASNSFFYHDPASLPPTAPSSSLSSEPHSFSRVFTGAFLEILSGMFRTQARRDEESLLTVSRDAGALLVDAVVASPVVPSYMSQIAAHMIEADRARFRGRYGDAIRGGFVRHGVISLRAATVPPPPDMRAQARRSFSATASGDSYDQPLAEMPVPGVEYGLSKELIVVAASEPKRFGVAGASPALGMVESPSEDNAALSFLEDLFRRGRVEMADDAGAKRAVNVTTARKTHTLVRRGEALALSRRYFDCGFDAPGV